MVDERLGVAIIGNSLEVDVAEPARRLPRHVNEPRPIIVVVDEDVAIRLDETAGSDQYVMQTAPMNFLAAPDQPVEMLGEPLAVTMARGGVEPIRINLRRQDGEVAKIASAFKASLLEDGT